MTVLYVLAAVVGLAIVILGMTLRVVQQFERGVVFRLGRVEAQARRPGPTFILPIVDRLQKVNMQIITLPVPAHDGITRDNVTAASTPWSTSASSTRCGWQSTSRTNARPSGGSPRPRYAPSSARACSTTFSATGSGSTKGWSS